MPPDAERLRPSAVSPSSAGLLRDLPLASRIREATPQRTVSASARKTPRRSRATPSSTAWPATTTLPSSCSPRGRRLRATTVAFWRVGRGRHAPRRFGDPASAFGIPITPPDRFPGGQGTPTELQHDGTVDRMPSRHRARSPPPPSTSLEEPTSHRSNPILHEDHSPLLLLRLRLALYLPTPSSPRSTRTSQPPCLSLLSRSPLPPRGEEGVERSDKQGGWDVLPWKRERGGEIRVEGFRGRSREREADRNDGDGLLDDREEAAWIALKRTDRSKLVGTRTERRGRGRRGASRILGEDHPGAL